MLLKNWFKLVKTAVINTNNAHKIHEQYVHALNQISFLESEYNQPSPELEDYLGTEICELKYCPEDWLGSLIENKAKTIHKCPKFNDEKCQNSECPTHKKNHMYFDALRANKNAEQENINSWKRVFGIKVR